MALLHKIISILSVLALSLSLLEGKPESVSVEEHIIKQLNNFAPIPKLLKEHDVDIRIRFSKTTKLEDNSTRIDYFELSSISDHVNATDDSKLDEDTLELIFNIAKYFNATGVVSTEKYARNGALTSRHFHAEDVAIEFDSGDTTIVYKNIAEEVQDEDEKALASYVNLMKGFELPVEVHRTLYNKSGDIQKVDFSKYEPKKVKVLETNMDLDMKFLCAEVLKRSALIQSDTKGRLQLVCRFLDIKHRCCDWRGVLGDTSLPVTNNTYIMKAVFEGETYTITGKLKSIYE